MIRPVAAKALAAASIVALLFVSSSLDDAESDRPDSLASTAANPYFYLKKRPGLLTLDGYVRFGDDEIQLLAAAKRSYGDTRINSKLRSLGLLPDHWAAATLQLLDATAKTQSADATLTTARLDVRAVVFDEVAWQRDVAAVEQLLAEHAVVSADSIAVDRNLDHQAACIDAFAGFSAGPINFEDSTVELRNSAYPRIERIAALASVCPDSTVNIEGHTDSTGPDSWNLELSRQRAAAVADYLSTIGVEPSRLRVAGLGSAKPIASNATRYGRGLNRRIEIRFEYAE